MGALAVFIVTDKLGKNWNDRGTISTSSCRLSEVISAHIHGGGKNCLGTGSEKGMVQRAAREPLFLVQQVE